MDSALLPGDAALTQESVGLFWYSRSRILLTLAFYFLVVLGVSLVIPPLQSPDESAHLKRAYLLSKGEIFLRSQDGSTGGQIDTGFLEYIRPFDDLPFHYDRKLSSTAVRSSGQIRWTGRRKFSILFTTAAYLPIPYLPQAIALIIGQQAKLTVAHTYYLARFLSLVTTLVLLYAAILVYPLPPPLLVLFATPMTLFQLGSASMDAITFGTCMLCAALFMRGSDTRYPFGTRQHIAFFLCLFSLATSRIIFVPLTILPIVLFVVRGGRSYLISSTICFVSSVGWTLFAAITVKGMPPRDLTTAEIAKFYITNPGELCHILYKTFTDAATLRFYWASFVGVLGWLDTPLDNYVYSVFAFLLLLPVIPAFLGPIDTAYAVGRIALAFGAIISLLALIAIELLAWTSFPTTEIDGIQGRYFTPILILLGYAVLPTRPYQFLKGLTLSLFLFTLSFSLINMLPKLMSRYWLQ